MTKRNIKQVDYDDLLTSVRQHRTSGQKQLQRVKKLSKTSKNSKENALLKTHHKAWDRIHAQLVSAKVKYQIDVEMWKSKQLEDSDESLKAVILECTDLESQLYDERMDFEKETVDPIWSLRIDLKGWLQGNSSPEEDRSVAVFQDHEGILEQLKLVKEQQNRIQELLEAEYDMLQSELDVFVSESLSREAGGLMAVDDRGVPKEALDLECPDVELKESALQEFLVVDEHYRSLLSRLEQSNKEVLWYVFHMDYLLTIASLHVCVVGQFKLSCNLSKWDFNHGICVCVLCTLELSSEKFPGGGG